MNDFFDGVAESTRTSARKLYQVCVPSISQTMFAESKEQKQQTLSAESVQGQLLTARIGPPPKSQAIIGESCLFMLNKGHAQ